MKKLYYLIFASLVLLASCVGTDVIDDGEPDTTILFEISPENTALLIDETTSYSVKYSVGGVEEEIFPTWSSLNESIATISNEGVATGVSEGSTTIIAEYEGQKAEASLVVVKDTLAIAEIRVTAPTYDLQSSGGDVQVTAKAFNILGNELTGKTFSFTSDNTSVATISTAGLISGVSKGRSKVSASAEGVTSAKRTFRVDINPRSGAFQGRSSYKAEGTATLSYNDDDDLILTFSSDFSTSTGPGLVMYLSNSGTTVATEARLGDLKANSGTQEYNITDINPNIDIDDFSHVVIWCEPFAVSFGFAELN